MGMSEREKRAYGWLGAPPPEIAACKKSTVIAWKTLAVEAGRVTRMPKGHPRTQAARAIGVRREELVARIINEARNEHG